MKTTILIAVASVFTLSVNAQKESIKVSPDTLKMETAGKVIARSTSNGDTLIVEKAKVLKIGEKIFYVSELGNPGKVVLIESIEWVVGAYNYLDNSNGGISKKQVEELQRPLFPYYQRFMQVMQQQRQSNQ